MGISLPLGGEGVLSSPRYYSAVRSHQAVGTTGLPLTQERRAGPIARVTIVSIIPKRLKEAAIHRLRGVPILEISDKCSRIWKALRVVRMPSMVL
jgi:hypothetical protein